MTWHPRAREEQMPIFVAFLYNLILGLGTLPSKSEFIMNYMEAYYKDIKNEYFLYYAFVDRVSKAYDSLVRNMHFYFKLAESQKFSDVLLSYAFDIEAKQYIKYTRQKIICRVITFL
ncbi:hypothetical protein [Neobacillus soli]|uniref:hypothetical protein n=1 Tax=Neobacillus soli TaxID=220688 RepID=UPI0008262B5A|nr:hypothetical protein [Neobacillus soli]